MDKLKQMLKKHQLARESVESATLLQKRDYPPDKASTDLVHQVKQHLLQRPIAPSKSEVNAEASREAVNFASSEADHEKHRHIQDIFREEYERVTCPKNHQFCDKVSYAEKCDSLRVFINNELDLWSCEHQQEGQPAPAIGTLKEELKPLLSLLATQKANKDIVGNFFHSAHFALCGRFDLAEGRYLEVAVGRKNWPLGIPFFGVHERTGTSRLYTSYILR